MADKQIYIPLDEDYCDETFEEDRRPSWRFSSEYEEHRHFDNLDRARDIRSSQ